MSIDNVEDIEPRVQYVAAAAQTAFDYPFPIFQDADIRVDVDGVAKTLSTHYTVTGEGDDTGGTVTFVAAMTGGETVTIYRDIAIERTSDFQQSGPWSSTTTNDELDRIVLILQQLEARIGRALRLPITGEATNAEIEFSPIASWLGKYVTINANGVPEPAALVSGTISQSVINALLYPGVDVRALGVVGNGIADDSTAMAAAIATGLPLQLGNLTIRIVTKLTFDQANQRIYATGGGFKYDGAATTRLADVTASGVEFHNVDFDFNSKQVLACGIYLESNASRPKFIGCRIRRINGTHVGGLTNNASNNQSGILISPYGVDGFEISGCTFLDLKNDNSGVNGTSPVAGLGFVNGVFMGITPDFVVPDTPQTVPTSGLINNCVFKDIITVLGVGLSLSDRIERNDADGIRFFGSSVGATKLHVKIQNCLFYDCGKRAVKNSTAAGTVIRNITVIATSALAYEMVCAVKCDGDDQLVDGVNIFSPAASPIFQMIQTHDCQFLRVSNVVANRCEIVWDLSPTSTSIITQGWRVKNIQCPNVETSGFISSTLCARYVDCEFSGLTIEAASGVHNLAAFKLAANTDRMEVSLFDSRIVNGDVKLNGYGWTLKSIYQEIDDSSYTGQSSIISLLEAGIDPASSVERDSHLEDYELNIKALPDAYLSASRPYLWLLYGKRVRIKNFKVTTPDSLATTRSHGAFGGGDDMEITDYEYSGEGWTTVGSIYTGPHRRMNIHGARRGGGTDADQEFLVIDHGQDCEISDVFDGRNATAGTIQIAGGTVSASHTYAYIIDGVRSFSTGTSIVVDSGNKALKLNVVGFDGRDQSEPRQANLVDGITAPGTIATRGQIYIDTADGDLKIKYGDGTVKTIVVDT